MIKVIPPNSYDFDAPATQIIKMGSRGLRGDDLKTFIKRAGIAAADVMQKIAFAKGEEPIHMLIIGANEYFGPNRNWDAFDEEDCKGYHNTFVKFARCYRNHDNKNPARSYGRIKESLYNDAMRRIELIAVLNGTKTAADKNGGLIADKEIDRLARGEDLAVSMATKLAYDVCSVCGNKAQNKSEYCDDVGAGGKCAGGGLKRNMGKIAADGTVMYTHNPRPRFFDASFVDRGADRTAFVFGRIEKAAAATNVNGLGLAELLGVIEPFELSIADISDPSITKQLKLARQLADVESNIHTQTLGYKYAAAQLPAVQPTSKDFANKWTTAKERAIALRALANEKIAMSLPNFLHFINLKEGRDIDTAATQVAKYLPGVYTRMLTDVTKLAADLKNNPFKAADYDVPMKFKKWAANLAIDYSLDRQHAQRRLWKASLYEVPVEVNYHIKAASDSQVHESLAYTYGLYKLAFLNEISSTDNDFELTQDIIVRQNYL